MKPPPPPENRPARPRPQSLCETCRHVRVIESERGSVFLLCRRSAAEPQYPKYPPQPVVACRGFES